MSPATLRIATRKSPLALWQAEHVAGALRSAHPTLSVELMPMTTEGDRVLDRNLAAIGGKGLFIKELEFAIADRRAHIAVHSMKDVPAELPDGFMIAAALTRADSRDALLARAARQIADLPHGARVGTSSLRRQAQLLAIRPDLRVESLRGNVNTRVRKLDEGDLDAVILACAGLVRLGWEARISARLTTAECLPAVSQGIIGIECHVDDEPTRALLQALNDPATRIVMEAERAFAGRLGGSCQSPIAAHATLDGSCLTLDGLVAQPDGTRILRSQIEGDGADAQRLGLELANQLLAAGAESLLERSRHA